MRTPCSQTNNKNEMEKKLKENTRKEKITLKALSVGIYSKEQGHYGCLKLNVQMNGAQVQASVQLDDISCRDLYTLDDVDNISEQLEVDEDVLVEVFEGKNSQDFCKQAFEEELYSMLQSAVDKFHSLDCPEVGELEAFAEALNLADEAAIDYERLSVHRMDSFPTGKCSEEFDKSDGIYSWDSESENSKGYPDFVLTNLTGRWLVEPAEDHIEGLGLEE